MPHMCTYCIRKCYNYHKKYISAPCYEIAFKAIHVNHG